MGDASSHQREIEADLTLSSGHQAARLVGATVFINDGPGPEGYLGECTSQVSTAHLELTSSVLDLSLQPTTCTPPIITCPT